MVRYARLQGSAALLLLSLCLNTGPLRAEKPEPSPTIRRQQRQMIELLEQRWDQACKDLVENRQSISLADAVRTGLINNPLLARRYAELQSASWQARAIRREWAPTLTGNNPNPVALAIRGDQVSGSQTGGTPAATTTSTTTSQSFYTTPRLQLNWTFLDPSRTPRLRSSLASERSQQLLFDVSARNLILEIQSAYYRLQEARELREDYNRIYVLTRNQIRTAIQLRRQGSGTQGDVDQLRAQLLQQLVQLIQLYEQELTAANQLAYSLSLKPGNLLLPSERLRPQGTWTTALQATIDEALAMREEIQASLAKADSYGWSATARVGRYLPTVSLLGQSQLNTLNQSQSVNAATSSWNDSISQGVRNDIGLNFNWLLFDGGATRAEATALRQQAAASMAQAEDDRLQATLQVQNSYATYTSSSMVIDTSKEQLKEARKSIDYTIKTYNGSTVSATTFIQNLQNYLNAAQAYKASVRRYNSAVASLYRYSARWPDSSLPDLNERLQQLSSQGR